MQHRISLSRVIMSQRPLLCSKSFWAAYEGSILGLTGRDTKTSSKGWQHNYAKIPFFFFFQILGQHCMFPSQKAIPEWRASEKNKYMMPENKCWL